MPAGVLLVFSQRYKLVRQAPNATTERTSVLFFNVSWGYEKNSTYFHVPKTVHIYCTTRYDKKGKEKNKETTSNDRRRNTR